MVITSTDRYSPAKELWVSVEITKNEGRAHKENVSIVAVGAWPVLIGIKRRIPSKTENADRHDSAVSNSLRQEIV